MVEHQYTYPDLCSVEDWLNAKGYTGEAGACHQAMSLIRKLENQVSEQSEIIDRQNQTINELRFLTAMEPTP